MQEINDNLLDKLLYMARLSLSENERIAMKKDLAKMTKWLKQLEEVDTKACLPITSMTQELNRFREDIPEKPLPSQALLHNAPDRSSQYFRTPSVQKN